VGDVTIDDCLPLDATVKMLREAKIETDDNAAAEG